MAYLNMIAKPKSQIFELKLLSNSISQKTRRTEKQTDLSIVTKKEKQSAILNLYFSGIKYVVENKSILARI